MLRISKIAAVAGDLRLANDRNDAANGNFDFGQPHRCVQGQLAIIVIGPVALKMASVGRYVNASMYFSI
jgi:hypothetical protein